MWDVAVTSRRALGSKGPGEAPGGVPPLPGRGCPGSVDGRLCGASQLSLTIPLGGALGL